VLFLFLAARPRRNRIKQQFLFTFRHVEIPGAIRRAPFKAFVAGVGQDTPLPEMFCLTRQSPGHTLFENFGAGD
jgi:hypothetical protein